MAFWNRFPYSNFHEINLDWIIREMKKISGSVSDFARQWEKALKQETGERQEADRQLQENIDAEQDRAEAAEEALDQKIEAETSRAEAAEKVLDDKITAETNRATEAEKALDQKIEAETDRATEKENDLQEQITAEVNRATAAEGTLDQKITAETNRATGVENELRGLITTETERATAKENELEQKITAETERATAAEEALGDRIDGLEGELEGVTGADSPFIRKDGTTTTTGKIPLAMGGTSEVDPAAATDLVNLRSMQAADQALENSMTEYVDNQLEAAVADVHSIPAGGTTGQVLGKASDADYAVQWVDQSGGGGDDPNAIKKDGTTTTTALIPFVRGVTSSSYYIMESPGGMYLPGYSGLPTQVVMEAQKVEAGSSPAHTLIEIGDTLPPDQTGYSDVSIRGGRLHIWADGSGGTPGQVLTRSGESGRAVWADPSSGSDPDAIKKDGTTVTTARIPFAEGLEVGSSFITDNDIKLDAKNTFAIGLNGVFPHEGQVLTAQRDGSCVWADAARGLPAGGTNGQILSITDDSGTVGWINPEQAAGAPSIITTFGSGNRFFYVMTTPSQGALKYTTVDVYTMNKITINSSYNISETIPNNVRPTGSDTYRSKIYSTDNTEISAYMSATTMNIDTSNNGKIIPEGTHVMSYMRKAQ